MSAKAAFCPALFRPRNSNSVTHPLDGEEQEKEDKKEGDDEGRWPQLGRVRRSVVPLAGRRSVNPGPDQTDTYIACGWNWPGFFVKEPPLPSIPMRHPRTQ